MCKREREWVRVYYACLCVCYRGYAWPKRRIPVHHMTQGHPWEKRSSGVQQWSFRMACMVSFCTGIETSANTKTHLSSLTEIKVFGRDQFQVCLYFDTDITFNVCFQLLVLVEFSDSEKKIMCVIYFLHWSPSGHMEQTHGALSDLLQTRLSYIPGWVVGSIFCCFQCQWQ